MKKLRLLITKECKRKCDKCVNKNFDLDSLETISNFSGFDEIILTGGEPMLDPIRVCSIIKKIKQTSGDAKIYLYTAKVDEVGWLLWILNYLDGITITLHTQMDFIYFHVFDMNLSNKLEITKTKSFRLNIFNGINVEYSSPWWKIKHTNWIDNCPLPKNEIFKRLPYEEKI